MTIIHVRPSLGNNALSGLTPETAVQTASRGMECIRANLNIGEGDLELAFFGGEVHNISAPIVLTNADNRTNRVMRFRSYGSGKAIITGRIRITGWTADGASGWAYAPFTGNTRDLWCDGAQLQRATLGKTNTFYRVFEWEQATKTLLISSSLVPVVSQIAGMEMVIQMGWSISHIPVQSIVDIGGGLHRVSFTTKAANAEFAKGDLSDPGLGTTFAYGPYHNNLGQRFWWQNNRFQFESAGDWYHDPVAQRLYVKLPSGVANAAELDALGVYVPNGSTFLITPEDYNFDAPSQVRDIDVTGLEFKNFGDVPVDRTEGFIGYLNGASLFDNAGSLGFRFVPALIGLSNCSNVRVTNNKYTDMSALAIRGQFGIKKLKFTGNLISKMEAGGIVLFGVTSGSKNGVPFVFDTMPESAWNEDIVIENNALGDGGLSLLGGAIFGGAARGLKIRRNTVKRWTDNGIECSNGARHFPLWVRDNEISYNDLDTVLTIKVDGGAIYSSGNIAGYIPSVAPNPNDAIKSLRIFANRIRNVLSSGYDPAGGFAAAVYQDLGSHGTIVYLNDIDNVEVAFKTNAAGICSFLDNKITNVLFAENHSFAGANIYTPGTLLSYTVYPPLANPPSVTDIQKFNGTDGYNSFRAVYPFASPEDVIGTDGKYRSLSLFARNGPATPVNLTGIVGASIELTTLLG